MKRFAWVPMALSLCLVVASPSRSATSKNPAGTGTKPAKQSAAQPAAAGEKTGVATGQVPVAVDSLGLLERAVAKDSTSFEKLYRLGVLYLDHDRIPEAQRVFTRASQIKPNDLRTLVNLGAAYDAAGSASTAQQYYRDALKVAPADSVAMCRLASSLYAQGSYQAALDTLRRIVAEKPGSHCAYFTLGVAFADAGLYRDAIRMWQKVVALAPDSPEAVSARESMDVLQKYLEKK